MQNIGYANALLKEFYEGGVRETLNNEILMKKYLEESTRKWAGRHVRFPVHYGRNTGTGARSESAALPTAGRQLTVEAQITSAYNYSRIDISGPVMASDKNAFADTLALEMNGAETDLVFELGRQSYGEGLGILAAIAGSASEAASGTTVTPLTVFNQFRELGQPGARYIKQGQLVDIGTIASPRATGSSVAVVSTVEAMNSGTTTDTVNLSVSQVTVSAGFLFSNEAGGAGIEMKGLRAIIDDQTATNCYGTTGGFFNNSTIFNIDRNTVKGWNSTVIQNSGTAQVIDSRLLQKFESGVKKKSGKQVNKYFGEYDVIDAFLDSVSGDRRFNTPNFDAGASSLTFNGKMLIRDLLAPYNELFGMNSDILAWYELQSPGWADNDGSILKNVSGYDRWEAFYRVYSQIAPDKGSPNACGVIREIKTNLS
jgi:hypothetical protein